MGWGNPKNPPNTIQPVPIQQQTQNPFGGPSQPTSFFDPPPPASNHFFDPPPNVPSTTTTNTGDFNALGNPFENFGPPTNAPKSNVCWKFLGEFFDF